MDRKTFETGSIRWTLSKSRPKKLSYFFLHSIKSKVTQLKKEQCKTFDDMILEAEVQLLCVTCSGMWMWTSRRYCSCSVSECCWWRRINMMMTTHVRGTPVLDNRDDVREFELQVESTFPLRLILHVLTCLTHHSIHALRTDSINYSSNHSSNNTSDMVWSTKSTVTSILGINLHYCLSNAFGRLSNHFGFCLCVCVCVCLSTDQLSNDYVRNSLQIFTKFCMPLRNVVVSNAIVSRTNRK